MIYYHYRFEFSPKAGRRGKTYTGQVLSSVDPKSAAKDPFLLKRTFNRSKAPKQVEDYDCNVKILDTTEVDRG